MRSFPIASCFSFQPGKPAGKSPLVRGWRVCRNWLAAHPHGCALLLGTIAACGFQPLGWWPATLIGLAGLIALIAGAPRGRNAALLGWLWGLGHFTLGNNWIATAFTYQAKMPPSLGWAAVVLLAAYLAVYPALAAWLAWMMAGGSKAAIVLAIAGSWIVSEWLRSWVFTGFAWNPLAAAALGSFTHPGLSALLPWLGTYALSGVVVLISGCWWAVLARGKFDAAAVAFLAAPIVLLLQPGHVGPRDPLGKIAYTLVQPNIDQATLDDPQFFQDHFLAAATLSNSAAPGLRRVVLWPESGVQDYLRDGYPPAYYRATTFAGDPALARARLGQVIGPGSLLLTGAVDVDFRGDRVLDGRNVVTAVDEHGAIRGNYAKAHLVPYGEYLPERTWLEPLGLARLVPGDIDFRPGPGAQTLDLGPWGRAGIQICYEIIFSGQVVDRVQRPDYIVNPSNDGWFGSWGPPQHLAQARLRAIEEGLPVLRPTLSGISAVIDADGIIRGVIPRGQAGRVDGTIPRAHPPTLFARLGNGLALGWAAILLVLSMVATRRQRG
ncbi:MAG: apolipoprotein N-acyltransferase [Pseudomonadota bacterium]|nr:apolipoprotein N-acyltransferase [Pseudomonadota bacterium]